MDLATAYQILHEYTKGEPLLKHAESVSIVMEAYAKKLGQNPEQWKIAGLLHDADYEAYPEKHPNLIVARLREMGEEDLAYAISAHYTKWGNEAKTLMDKALIASDELTGFIIACARVRPDGLDTLESTGVMKKLKQKSFAAGVDREEVQTGAELLGVSMEEHIAFIIEALRSNQFAIR